ncbi:MAG: ferrous iron transport protein A [Epsilonproteobacteria bacterium]|nr:MAG: ferrous iron transport protein A [Campylobacterota bacterium]
MKSNQRLDTMKKGQKYKIAKLHTKGKLMHKLLDMGFVVGSEVEVVREAPLYDPMELKIHNYSISLRKSEANLIEVEK